MSLKSTRPVAPTIKQDELEAICTLRLVAETKARELKAAKEDLDRAELVMIDKVQKGAPTQPGALSAAIHVDLRRVPSYKEEIAKRLGPAVIDEIMASTVPREYPRLMVLMNGKVWTTF